MAPADTPLLLAQNSKFRKAQHQLLLPCIPKKDDGLGHIAVALHRKHFSFSELAVLHADPGHNLTFPFLVNDAALVGRALRHAEALPIVVRVHVRVCDRIAGTSRKAVAGGTEGAAGLGPHHVRVNFIQEPTPNARFMLTKPETTPRLRQKETTLRPRRTHVEEPPFFLQFFPLLCRLRKGK
jgi:hypothetical protein